MTNAYSSQFSTPTANKLIGKCLYAVEKSSPDIKLLLNSLHDLAKLIQTADYDHHLMNNLISENQLLVIERDTLKLAQISSLVSNMDLKLEKAERDCRVLQAELDEPEFSSFHPISVHPMLLKVAS